MRKSELGFHQGNTLLRLAETYPKLDLVILEYIQNALDIGARNIWVKISFRNRYVYIRDDGDGVSVEHFERALKSVCSSIKGKDKLGRYGIGLVSGIDKCKELIFTSTPKENPSDYKKWVFEGNIVEQKSIDGIPCFEEKRYVFSKDSFYESKSKEVVNWRTEIRLESITKDRTLTRISSEDFRSAILERYSEVMRKKGVTVFLIIVTKDERTNTKIQASEFQGKKLPTQIETGKDAGKTVFDLYIANKKAYGRRGKVHVGIDGNDFRIGFPTFARFTNLFNSETIQILESGIFEGNIISQKCTLHPGRRGFVENDALLEFCAHIETWMEKEGVKYASEINQEKKDERYQALGIRSMRVIEDILADPKFSNLRELLSVRRSASEAPPSAPGSPWGQNVSSGC